MFLFQEWEEDYKVLVPPLKKKDCKLEDISSTCGISHN